MSVETATYVADLNPSNPAASDQRNQGDDHIRLLKAALQATFPNASGKFYFPTTVTAQTSDPTPAAPTNCNVEYPMNCTSGNLTFTLPTGAGLFDGYVVRVFKSDFGPNYVTIDPNGKTINGLSSLKLTKAYQYAQCRYSAALAAWVAEVTAVVPTGTFMDNVGSTLEGYVICDGVTTIGDASSGASVAAANTSALFQLLWNSVSNSVCAVSSGRGASAAADYAAHKKITMPDLRGRTRYGKDNMGGSTASRITTALAGFDGTTMGASGGAQSFLLTETYLPSLTKNISATFTGTPVADHRHETIADATTGGSDSTPTASNSLSKTFTSGTSTQNYTLKSDDATEATLGRTSLAGGHTPAGTISGTVSFGSGTTYGLVSPGFITNVFMAL